MNLGAFLVVTLVHRQDGTFDLRDYAGLVRRSPFLTFAMARVRAVPRGHPAARGLPGQAVRVRGGHRARPLRPGPGGGAQRRPGRLLLLPHPEDDDRRPRRSREGRLRPAPRRQGLARGVHGRERRPHPALGRDRRLDPRRPCPCSPPADPGAPRFCAAAAPAVTMGAPWRPSSSPAAPASSAATSSAWPCARAPTGWSWSTSSPTRATSRA